MNQAELIATVASAAVAATLATTGGTRSTPIASTPRRALTPPSTPFRRQPVPVDRDALGVAVHESAHAVSGVMLGAELRSVLVGELRGGLMGQAYFHDRPHGTDPLIAYAGPWAQARFQAGGRRPTQREFFTVMDGPGCLDRRVLTAAGGAHHGADVVPIIDHAWPAILTVAAQLHRAGEVHQEDVLRALGVNTARPIRSQLSSIRAGMQQVPSFKAKTLTPA